jgi:hypothetical protein
MSEATGWHAQVPTGVLFSALEIACIWTASAPNRVVVFRPKTHRHALKHEQSGSPELSEGRVRMVRAAGFEPAWHLSRGILSPLRLPVSPRPRCRSAYGGRRRMARMQAAADPTKTANVAPPAHANPIPSGRERRECKRGFQGGDKFGAAHALSTFSPCGRRCPPARPEGG